MLDHLLLNDGEEVWWMLAFNAVTQNLASSMRTLDRMIDTDEQVGFDEFAS